MGQRETCDTEETGKRGINYIHGRCTWKQGIEELMHGHRDKTMHTQINVHVHVANTSHAITVSFRLWYH